MAIANKIIDCHTSRNDEDLTAKAELLSIMANGHRLHMLFLLSKRDYSLTELTRELDETTVALSRHLMILRENNIITGRRHGKMVRYSLTSERVARMIATIADMHFDKTESSSDEPALDSVGDETASVKNDVTDLARLLQNFYPSSSQN